MRYSQTALNIKDIEKSVRLFVSHEVRYVLHNPMLSTNEIYIYFIFYIYTCREEYNNNACKTAAGRLLAMVRLVDFPHFGL